MSEQRLSRNSFVALGLGGFCALLMIVNHLRGLHTLSELPGVIGVWTLVAAPVFLGILAGLGRPQAPAKAACKLVALCFLVGAPALGEGVVCMIFLTPIGFIVAPLVALITARFGKSRALLVIPFVFPFLEPRPTDLPLVTMTDSVDVDQPIERVWASIDTLHMTFLEPAPWLVRLGLPTPLRIEGGGTFVGAERRVVFDNGVVVATVTGSERLHHFAFDLRVEQAGREFFDHWSVLENAEFDFESLPNGQTRITHSSTYRAFIFPRWYAEPLERFGGQLVQRYMLEAYVKAIHGESDLVARLP
jgi:hypothetical protein